MQVLSSVMNTTYINNITYIGDVTPAAVACECECEEHSGAYIFACLSLTWLLILHTLYYIMTELKRPNNNGGIAPQAYVHTASERSEEDGADDTLDLPEIDELDVDQPR